MVNLNGLFKYFDPVIVLAGKDQSPSLQVPGKDKVIGLLRYVKP